MKSFHRILSLFLAVLMISGIAVVSASADTAAEKTSGTFDMHVAFSTDTKTDKYFYCDDYFTQSGKASDEHLRTMSAAVAFTLYGKSENPEAVFGKLPSDIGFEDITMYDMDKLTKDTMGVVFGKKTIGGNTVVLVALRSDEYDAEWASNFISGETGDISGFSTAAALIKSRLDKYLSDNAVTNAKFWVTGYSRGGAVANLLGKSLNEHTDDYRISDDDIYVYTFDAPRSSFELTSYANIHNVVDSCDIIPYVYPEIWGIYNSGVVEPVGSDDETIMTKQFNLFSPDPMDYKEFKTSDFLREFADFLGTNLSRETYSRNVAPYISRIAEIYFSLNIEARESFVEFFKAVLTSVDEDENKLSVLLPLLADGSGQEDIDKVVEFLRSNIDKVAETSGKPIDDESFEYIRSSVEPLVNVLVPVFIADLKGPLPDDADNMSLLYHILSFSNNIKGLIKHHYNYKIFDELKA
ncbi:MAG: hypothetical protein K6F88_07320, partial [Ruminococcus sp.]|nr:hypothetical protein [Ruminococcus sp.]